LGIFIHMDVSIHLNEYFCRTFVIAGISTHYPLGHEKDTPWGIS